MNQLAKEKQAVIVRGVAASIQAMAMPTFGNLEEILNKFGWDLKRLPEHHQTNKQDENRRKG